MEQPRRLTVVCEEDLKLFDPIWRGLASDSSELTFDPSDYASRPEELANAIGPSVLLMFTLALPTWGMNGISKKRQQL